VSLSTNGSLTIRLKIREKLGFTFDQIIDSQTEKNAFDGFLYQYFKFYLVNLKNILFSLKFYPLKHLKFVHHLFFVKKYYKLMRYSKNINKAQ